MNTDLPRLSETPPGVALCRLEEIVEGSARSFVLQLRAGRFHGFVVRRHDLVRGYVDRCPHAGMPLARRLDEYLTLDGTLIACGWHGALFRVEDGACVGGPCTGGVLTPWPIEIENAWIVTARLGEGSEKSLTEVKEAGIAGSGNRSERRLG